jgi:hypothetical protein
MMSQPLRRQITVAGALATLAVFTGVAVAATSAPSLPVPNVPVSKPAPERAMTLVAPGSVLNVPIDALRPTQPAIGFDQVYASLERYRRSPQEKFDDYCFINGQRGVNAYDAATSRLDTPSSFTCKQDAPEAPSAHAATLHGVVIGPGGRMYVQSGHHSLATLVALPDGGPQLPVHVRVVANYSQMAPSAFWTRMAAERRVWLRDEMARMIVPESLPHSFRMDDLRDDPYRSLVFFTRGIGYERPPGASPHVEMTWATWLRKRRDPDLSDVALDSVTAYRDAVIQAARKMVALRDNDILIDRSTALSLGKLKSFDANDDLRKLTREGTATQAPGPLLDALAWKQRMTR